MNQVPQVIIADRLLDNWTVCGKQELGRRDRCVLARPMSRGGIMTRLRLAVGVFTGKYDALKWVGQ